MTTHKVKMRPELILVILKSHCEQFHYGNLVNVCNNSFVPGKMSSVFSLETPVTFV